MALRDKSLFVYGLEVTNLNRSIDFKSTSGGIEKQATLNLGFYTVGSLCTEIARAMTAADPVNTFTATAVRTYNNNTENRIFISTSSSFLSLLFATGSRSATTAAPLIGFNSIDYTGTTTYGGSFSAGTSLVPDFIGYNYLGPEFNRVNFGSVNVAANGAKEAIVFQIQRFIMVEFKYEPEDKVITDWVGLWNWLIQQRSFEFTPQISSPTVFYDCTLETTASDGKGLGYSMKEMLPQFPFLYQTGALKFRQNAPPTGFL